MKRTNIIAGAAVLGVVTLASIAFAGKLEHPVCPRQGTDYTLVAQKSASDGGFTVSAAPRVAAQVASRAAQTCSAINTIVANNRPEADAVLRRIVLAPNPPRASDPRPVVGEMERFALARLDQDFVGRLRRMPATPTSPILSALAAAGRQQAAAGRPPGLIVLLSDGVVVEEGLAGKGPVDFRRAVPPSDEAQRLAAFRPSLRPLAGATVVLLGFGAGSHLGQARLDHASSALTRLLRSLGARLIVTRSLDLPEGVS